MTLVGPSLSPSLPPKAVPLGTLPPTQPPSAIPEEVPPPAGTEPAFLPQHPAMPHTASALLRLLFKSIYKRKQPFPMKPE